MKQAKKTAETSKHILALEVIAFKTIGEMAHPILTKSSTTVVAKLTEFFGALQSSQLYMYGTESPKPIPKTKLPTASMAKLTDNAMIKKPSETIRKPIGKILSCNFLKKKPNEAPTGILTKFKIPVNNESSLTVPSFSSTTNAGILKLIGM